MPAAKPTPGTLRKETELSRLLGGRWEGFAVIPGDVLNGYQARFRHTHWRRPFEIGELCSAFHTTQEVYWHRHAAEQLKKELEKARRLADEAEGRAEYYRRQLVAESRLGLMLQPLMT